MPFVRSGVLEIDGRSHIVAVADLSPEGAFLSTRVRVSPDSAVKLKMVLPRDGREVTLPCRLVRSNAAAGAATARAGVAVRFHGLDATVVRRVEEFALEGFLPSRETVPSDHVEYRLVELPEVDVKELNRLGLDGWILSAALPTAKGVRFVLMRRL